MKTREPALSGRGDRDQGGTAGGRTAGGLAAGLLGEEFDMVLLTGSAHPELASRVARHLGTPLAACLRERFPDGELHVELKESVRGQNVCLIQPTSPPVEQHLFELLLLSDACRRAGARLRTAVMPYFGYARQDRRAVGREPIGARVAADALAAAAIDAAVVLDLHSPPVEGFFSMPVDHLTAVPLLARAMHANAGASPVLVAPDLGAARLADRYSRLLDWPVATIYKTRLSGREVRAQQIVGDVRDRTPFIVDDMISTGGTVAAAVRALLAAGCRPELTVVATHGVFAEPAAAVLDGLPIARLITTDSVAPKLDFALPVDVVSIASLIADTIRRLDRNESLRGLVEG